MGFTIPDGFEKNQQQVVW